MRLKQEVDAQIQASLKRAGIEVTLDDNRKILVHEYRMDPAAKAGMLYLKPSSQVPRGELPFFVAPGWGVYGVFHVDGEAVSIEVSFLAMDI